MGRTRPRWLGLVGSCRPDRTHLRRGVHRSTRELEAPLRYDVECRSQDVKPFVRAKMADEILQAVARSC